MNFGHISNIAGISDIADIVNVDSCACIGNVTDCLNV